MEPLFLLLEEVLAIHLQQIERYGGHGGIRDRAALESAIAVPLTTFEGRLLHEGIPAIAAAYLFHICQNHPFIDGNKRVGANAAITFLFMNDWEPDWEEDELAELVLSVASGQISKSELTRDFEQHCHPAKAAL